MTRELLRRRPMAHILLLTAILACGETGPSEQLPPAAVTNVTGIALTGTAGEALAERVVIRVDDASGNPLPGVTVTFTASGNGTVDPTSAVTDNDGEARTRWTLGRTPGTQTLTVTAGGGATAQINATAGPPRIASLTINAGNNQSGPTSTNLPVQPSVVARDAANAPVQGVTVFFNVMSGGGTVTNASAVTDAQGIASAGNWRLGAGTGTHLLSAQVPQAGVANNPTIFTATATSGAPASVTALSATQQSAPVNALVSSVPSVVVRDAAGNPVPNVNVTFAVTAGGGQVTAPAQQTNVLGIATVASWRLGASPGNNTLTATVAGVATVTFSATATAGAPTQIEKTAGDNQTAQVNRPVAIPPEVRVRDAAGNGVVGIPVTFAVATGDGSVVVGNVTTGSDGRAAVGAWILGPTLGTNTLTATAAGLAPVTFTATAVGGAAVAMLPVSQVTQTGTAGLNAASPPSVVVRDAQGNPVEGVTVNFSISGGGGSLTGGTQITGSNGVATVGSWTFGPVAGLNTVIATSGTLPAVTFTATTSGTPTTVVLIAGDNQAGVAGVATAIRPAVRVTDANGIGVPNVTVTFAVTNGGGSVTGSAPVTDAAGVATVGSWTLGAGLVNTMTATAPGLTGSPVTFNASSATQIVITQQPPANVPTLTNFNVTVELRNANNVPVPVNAYPLTIAIQSGGGTLNPGSTGLIVNTSGGAATFNVNITGPNGNRTLRITGTGLPTAITNTITTP